MQKSYMKKSILTIVVFCLLMMFCIPFVGVFAEETTEPDKTPNFKFLNTPYKGVTVKLNTYDYTDYWDKIHTEKQFSEAETMREQYAERYTVNQLAIDEFSVVLKGSADGKDYQYIPNVGYKRFNQSGMYYHATVDSRKYIICPTGTADFTVYYRNDDGNIVYVFDTGDLTRSDWHDMTIQTKYNAFDETKITQFKSADIETRLTLLFGMGIFHSEFTTESNGIFYLFDGDWADFDHVHEDESRNFIKAYTIMKATTEDSFQSVEDINSKRLIPYKESNKENEHTNQKKYTGVYKNTDYFSSESNFSIYKDGLTTLYVNEYFGLSEDELQIEKAVNYWNGKTNPLDDSFEFTIKIADKDISESEEYQYYISNVENPPETAKVNSVHSTQNAKFKLKGGDTLHIIGLIEGQNVLVQEAAYAGYGIVTDEKVTYDTTNGYHTELQYKKTDNKRTFTNYPLAIALTKEVINYADNQETVDKSEFVFELCKQENNTITPLTEEEMLGMKAWVVKDSEFIKLDFGGSVGNQFTLKHGQTVVITGVKADTQYVAREIDCKIDGESSNSSYQKENNGLTYLKSTLAITKTSSPNYQTASFSGTQKNTYQNSTGLTISKQIENDYDTLTNPNAEYLFQILQVTKENDTTTETPLKNKKYTINGSVEKTTTEQGYFTLKQNEYAFFSISQKGIFKVIEIDPNKKYSDDAYKNQTTGLSGENGSEYYSESNQTNPLPETEGKLFESNDNITNEIVMSGIDNQNLNITNRVIDKEYQFDIEKIIYRDKNLHGDTNDNEQRFVFKVERYAKTANVDSLPENPLDTFYITLNCPNQVVKEDNNYKLKNTIFTLPDVNDSKTYFDKTTQKITKKYRKNNSDESYTYPATIWQGNTAITVNRQGVYRISEVTEWSGTDYDYCNGSNAFKGENTIGHSDYSLNHENTDYVAFVVDNSSTKTASFSNAESEYAFFSSSAYAINKIKQADN